MVYVEFFLKASVESKVQLKADRTSEMTSSPLAELMCKSGATFWSLFKKKL